MVMTQFVLNFQLPDPGGVHPVTNMDPGMDRQLHQL